MNFIQKGGLTHGKKEEKEPIPGKALAHLPLYCFTIKNPDSFQILGGIRKLRTAVLFNLYYSLLIIALFVLLGIILANPT
ncbi:MAG: hypothetical protein Q4B50_05795 [Bacillota bacterium]|nr:hypothetical protein [Bacillota bacterium]